MTSITLKHMFFALALAAGALSMSAAGARSPYVSEIADYVYPQNAPASLSDLVYMPDGLSYLTMSADRSAIVRYDTKTGKEIEVFADLSKARETTLTEIDGFTLSADASKIQIGRAHV